MIRPRLQSPLVTASAFWDRQATANRPRYWADYPAVRRYVNECVTDSWWAYPTHGFKAGWAYKPLARGLSIGCGTGLLERDLRWLRICEEVDAFDISPESIRLARERAASDGFDHVHFEVADCEQYDYRRDHYDAVFFHGSMHHMSDPAALLDRIAPALHDGGLIFLDDYVGPSRDQWRAVDLSLAQAAYDKLPRAWRTVETLSPPFDASDPSEMIRSDAILPAVRAHFETLWERPYWGNILFPVLSNVVEAEAGAADAEGILNDLIAYERRLVRDGVIKTPYFVWMTGKMILPPRNV